MRASSFGRDDPALRPLSDAMLGLGYVEGRDYKLEQLSARNQPDRVPVLARELVQRKVDVIVTTTTVAAQAAKEATATIPIVMIAYDRDPVAAGLVQTLARPGGNVTGVSALQQDLIGKRLEAAERAAPVSFQGGGPARRLDAGLSRGPKRGSSNCRRCSCSGSRCAGPTTSNPPSRPPRGTLGAR